MSETGTYLYCVVERKTAPALSRAPAGLPETGKVRALAAGQGLWLLAADCPMERYSARAIEKGLKDLDWVSACALPHEAVVEFAAKGGTVLPMKLFTIFLDDERAIAHVTKQRKDIERILERVRDRDEWGVRVLIDRAQALRASVERAEKAGGGASPGGTAFLLRKKREQDAAREAMLHAKDRVDELFDVLAGRADDARRRPPPPGDAGRAILLDAAYLVPRGKARTFQAAVKARAEELAPHGYEVTLSGPWPAYNFLGEAR